MVVSVLTVYMCPYCDSKYRTYREADDCASECADTDPVEECSVYVCPVCKKWHDEEDDAEDCCSDKHEGLLYEEYLREESFRKLDIAGHNPSQKKILEVLK